jgi:hypothetical protein
MSTSDKHGRLLNFFYILLAKNVYGTGPLILQMEVDLVVFSDVQEFRLAP